MALAPLCICTIDGTRYLDDKWGREAHEMYFGHQPRPDSQDAADTADTQQLSEPQPGTA